MLLGLLLVTACNTGGNLRRSLSFVDVLEDPNLAYHQFPNELSTQLLSGVLQGEIEAFDIDYLGTGSIASLSIDEFKTRISEPYDVFVQVPSQENDVDTLEHAWTEYFGNASILSFDGLWSDGSFHRTLYINFYHPEEIALEGFNKYVCSIEFETALQYLEENPSHSLWHNFKYQRWGWVAGKIFKGDIETSSNLGLDLLTHIYHSQDSARLPDGITLERVQQVMGDNTPNIFASIPTIEGVGSIYVKTRSTSTHLADYDWEIIHSAAPDSTKLEEFTAMPLHRALQSRSFHVSREVDISKNGVFTAPLSGDDPLSTKAGGQSNLEESPMAVRSALQIREVNRIFDASGLHSDLGKTIYEGIRDGKLTVFDDDTLMRRRPSGDFFDALLYEDLETRKSLGPEVLEVYFVIWETTFTTSGDILEQVPLGIGLIVPGRFVPEGFNREAGYFELSDVNALLEEMDKAPISIDQMDRGFPLRSWNIREVPPDS